MAAIGLADAILAQRDPDAAADHMISGTDAFLSSVSEVVLVAQKGYLVTIGIAPSHPSTGFGYVRLGDRLGMPDALMTAAFMQPGPTTGTRACSPPRLRS